MPGLPDDSQKEACEKGMSPCAPYDANGNLVRIIDEMSHETVYRYDDANRRDQETLPNPEGAGPKTAIGGRCGFHAQAPCAGQSTRRKDAAGGEGNFANEGVDRGDRPRPAVA